MQLNKCSRCGCFFVSGNDVCPNCAPKDANEINKLKNFLEENNSCANIEQISYSTGISSKNLHRFFQSDSLISNLNETQNNIEL